MPGQAHAYIGPGAGFALAGSFFAVFAAICSALLMLLTWPVRLLCAALFWRRAVRAKPRQARRDPRPRRPGPRPDRDACSPRASCRTWPRCATRAASSRWARTLPPISPVAWSSFQTGVNPGKHNIFDFLDARPATPTSRSSARSRSGRRGAILRLGKYRIPARQGRRAAAAQEQAVLERARASTASSTASSACRSRFRRRSSAACSSRRCACPTCAARRACSRTTRREPRAKARRPAAKCTRRHASGNTVRAELDRPAEPAAAPTAAR